MATNYPGSLDSFPARANGTAIDATHIGNLQDSVLAVETALGTNPKGSATDVAARLTALEAPTFPMRSGSRWYPCALNSAVAAAATAPALGTMTIAAFYVPTSIAIDTLAVNITIAGAATCTMRLSLYSPAAATGLPTGTPFAEVGGLASNVTGVVNATVSTTLPKGWVYAAYTAQGSGTVPTLTARDITSGSPYISYSGTYQPTSFIGYSGTGMTGANNDLTSASLLVLGSMPRIGYRTL